MNGQDIDRFANDVKDQFYEDSAGRHCTAGLLSSKKGFYVGDICYVLSGEVYHRYWGEKKDWKEGVYHEADFGFAVGSTKWGDGDYTDNRGHDYGVDAGVIGVVPYETLVKYGRFDEWHVDPNHIEESVDRLGHFFEGECASFVSDDGVFEISIDGKVHIVIDTAGSDEEDEEE